MRLENDYSGKANSEQDGLMSEPNLAKSTNRQKALTLGPMLASLIMLVWHIVDRSRRSLLFVDGMTVLAAAIIGVATQQRIRNRARRTSTALSPSHAGIISAPRYLVVWLLVPLMAFVILMIYHMYKSGTSPAVLAPLVAMQLLMLVICWRIQTGTFDDILGPYIEEGCQSRHVYILWKTGRSWTKLATYYYETEATRQCDSLSQALGIPPGDRAEAENKRRWH